MHVLLALALAAAAPEAKIEKQTFTSADAQRTVYTFVPDAAVGKPAPLIITLHGSGRDGRLLVEHWKDLAAKEGIILAGPDATKREGWHMGEDGPDLLRDLVEHLKSKYAIDEKRVYLFGHSAGAIQGLALGVLESEYFAAIAAHAGILLPELEPIAEDAPRSIPIGLWIGTADPLFPLEQVRATHAKLKSLKFPVEIVEIKGHTHDYYRRSAQINKEAWAFLQQHKLDKAPRFQQYAK